MANLPTFTTWPVKWEEEKKQLEHLVQGEKTKPLLRVPKTQEASHLFMDIETATVFDFKASS